MERRAQQPAVEQQWEQRDQGAYPPLPGASKVAEKD
jgi:hypothetical protein